MVFNFSWIVPDSVGGMGHPGPHGVLWLADEQGVTALVSLTERAPDSEGGVDVLHVPVVDMTAPSLDQLHQSVAFMRGVVEKGGRVVAHCGAGMGRTGTVLAAYLISTGISAAKAIANIRALRPGSIETSDQEATIARFAELMGSEP